MDVLDADSASFVPLAHLGLVKAVLSNLRRAGFRPAEMNVLVRGMYSWNDPLNGEALREATWHLLLEMRGHLRAAGDAHAEGAPPRSRRGMFGDERDDERGV